MHLKHKKIKFDVFKKIIRILPIFSKTKGGGVTNRKWMTTTFFYVPNIFLNSSTIQKNVRFVQKVALHIDFL